MKKSGFTLLEILIGLGLVAMLFTVTGAVLSSSLRSTRKAAAVAVAKTEGAFAIRSMSDMIRYAQAVTCHATLPRLQVDRTNRQSVVYRFDAAGTPLNKIASQSGTFTAPGTITVDLTTEQVEVSITECGGTMFTCSSQGRVVEICFAIDNAAGVDVTDHAGATGGIVFRTRVTMANRVN